MAGGSIRLRPRCCLPIGVLEPDLFPNLSRASSLASMNSRLRRRVRRTLGRLCAFRENGGQEFVHLIVLDQAELPKHRYTDEFSGHFLDWQVLINDLQHSRVVAFVGVNG